LVDSSAPKPAKGVVVDAAASEPPLRPAKRPDVAHSVTERKSDAPTRAPLPAPMRPARPVLGESTAALREVAPPPGSGPLLVVVALGLILVLFVVGIVGGLGLVYGLAPATPSPPPNSQVMKPPPAW